MESLNAYFDATLEDAVIVRITHHPPADAAPTITVGQPRLRQGDKWRIRSLEDGTRTWVDGRTVTAIEVIGVLVEDYDPCDVG